MNRKQRRAQTRIARPPAQATPSPIQALFDQAFQCHLAGNLAEAEAAYRRILAIDSRHADSLHLLGVIAYQVGKNDAAAALIAQAIAINAAVAAYHSNLGNALKNLGRLDEAIAAYDSAIRLKPDYADAHYNRGALLGETGRLEDAVAAYRAAIRINPDHAEALANLGKPLKDLGRISEAVAALRSAIRVRPDHAETHSNLGNLLREQSRLSEALDAYQVALCLKPDYAEAHSNLGVALNELGRLTEAVSAYQAAIRVKPDYAEAHSNLGVTLYQLGRMEEAVAAFDAALALKPDLVAAISQLVHCLQHICAWTGLAQFQRELLRLVPEHCEGIPPFVMLSVDSSAEQQLAVARRWAKEQQSGIPPLEKRPRPAGARLRLGYLSGDFRNHPVASLIAELIERHDRQRFEVIGYSYGADDQSRLRQRLMTGFDRFVDIRSLPQDDAARLIHRDGIDILIDLAGYTENARTKILAFRPAALQVNFLGYPGTMGGDFVDYIIADPVCIPPGEERFFSEKVLRLPDCYQPNDRRREIAEHIPSRSDCGLPERGFVFCCFNNSYKISPALFALWMRLLARLPDSVLWLLEANDSAKNNLRREAAAAGIAPERLIFAPRRPLAEHLARHRQADLFLDTLPYNAHTTASDALWAGLPVLTCRGGTFAGRVAASLLAAVGLPELVTSSLADYENLAMTLATTPDRLDSLKQKLAANRLATPLFDSARFARAIESAFQEIWDIHCIAASKLPTNRSASQSGEASIL